jgi:glycosyltransferase involved in cell wall biosynthesis
MMPAHNAARFIGPALQSVFSQSYADWELIVVNDGSTDDTLRVVSEHADARLRLLNQENKGESAARNAALRVARGEFVAFLDADDEWLPHHLAVTVDPLRTHEQLSAVYTDGYYVRSDGRRLKRLSERRRPAATGRVFDEVVRGSDLLGPPLCVVLRRALIQQNHLWFDEEIVIGPDWDFFVRFAEVGSFGYVDAVTCLYRVHDTNITFRIGLEKRARELAKCRLKALATRGFAGCALDVRVNVFHDLLVNLLRGRHDDQRAVLARPQFAALPLAEQARLLRLTASRAILSGGQPAFINECLERSRLANRRDVQGAVLNAAYAASPAFCRTLLRLRTVGQHDPIAMPPLADLDLGGASGEVGG